MPEPQAKIIVDAIAESHADLVRKEDLEGLKHYLLWRGTLIGLALVAFARVLAYLGL